MEDFLLSESELEIKLKARKVAKSIPPDLIRSIESETKKFPREFGDINAKANMLGLRFSKEYGGRGASWVADMAAVEEMGYLGFTPLPYFSISFCLFSLFLSVALHRSGRTCQGSTTSGFFHRLPG